MHILWIGAVIDIVHDRAVAIEENGWRFSVSHLRNSFAILPAKPLPSPVCPRQRRWRDWQFQPLPAESRRRETLHCDSKLPPTRRATEYCDAGSDRLRLPSFSLAPEQ